MEYFLIKHEIGKCGFLLHAELIIRRAEMIKMHDEKTTGFQSLIINDD